MHGHVWWLVLIPLIPCHPRTARSCVARRGCQTLASKSNAVSTGKERGAPCRSLDTPPTCAEPSDAFLCASGGRKQPATRPSASLKVRRRSSSRPPNHDSKLAPNGCSALSRTRREPATPIVEGVRQLVREKVRHRKKTRAVRKKSEHDVTCGARQIHARIQKHAKIQKTTATCNIAATAYEN